MSCLDDGSSCDIYCRGHPTTHLSAAPYTIEAQTKKYYCTPDLKSLIKTTRNAGIEQLRVDWTDCLSTTRYYHSLRLERLSTPIIDHHRVRIALVRELDVGSWLIPILRASVLA